MQMLLRINASIDILHRVSCVCQNSFIHAIINTITQVLYMRELIHANDISVQSLTKVISHY